MTELCIARGRDIELYLDDALLCGVTHLKAESHYRQLELYEYLSAEPYAKAPQGETHEITLTVLPLFGGAIPLDGRFSLQIADAGVEYVYDGCMVTAYSRDARGDRIVTDHYKIKADRMTKRRNTDV